MTDSTHIVTDTLFTASQAPQDHTVFLIVALVALVVGLYMIYQTEIKP